MHTNKRTVKIPILILLICITFGLLQGTASANITVDTDTTTTTETETSETQTRTTPSSEYSHTTTTTSTTTSSTTTSTVFNPVRSITNVPDSTTVRIPLILTATVNPRNATNIKIIWDVVDPGGTGAVISGDNVLNTTAPGTVTVRAIITNGANVNIDYIERFSVTVYSPGFLSAPSRIGTFSEHAVFTSSGNFFDLFSVSINGHELTLTDDNERILLFGYPGFSESLGRITEGSNIIRLNRSFLTFLPDGVHTLSLSFRAERSYGRVGRVYATTDTIFVLDRTMPNNIPPTNDESNIYTWVTLTISSAIGIFCLLIWRRPWQKPV